MRAARGATTSPYSTCDVRSNSTPIDPLAVWNWSVICFRTNQQETLTFEALERRIVHIGCEALVSGGDLVLEWAMGAVEMDEGDAAEILSISASHSGLITATATDVDTPGAGYFGGLKASGEIAQVEAVVATSRDERQAEEGLITSGEHIPLEGEEGLETSPRNGLEGVGVEAQQTFRGCSRRYSRRLRRYTMNPKAENLPNPEILNLEAYSQTLDPKP